MKRINAIFCLLVVMISSCGLQEGNPGFYQLARKLDSRNLDLLDSLVRRMENHLESTYETGNTADNYKSYFLNIVLGNSHLKISESQCLVLRHFEDSDLGEKYSVETYDTVYMVDDLIVSVIDTDTAFEIIPGTAIVPKLVRKKMEYGFRRLREKGNCMKP